MFAKGLAHTKTEFPPCCFKFFPLNTNIALIGTYKYDTHTKRKYGSVEIFQYPEMRLIRKILTENAILDLQFSPANDNLFVTGDSNGDLIFWDIQLQVSGEVKIEKLKEIQIFDDGLITSIKFQDIHPNRIAMTSTTGSVSIFDIPSERTIYNYEAHSLEAWISNFGNANNGFDDVVFSGGDDCKLIATDIRSKTQVFATDRIHSAGITSILTNSSGDSYGRSSWLPNNNKNPYHLYTGSYDDTFKISDLRYFEDEKFHLLPYPPKVINEKNLGGGVWRLVPFKEKSNKLLVCCMYDGAKIIEIDNEDIKVDRVFRENHNSMVYGADTCFSNDTEQFVGTCSFYDCSVQIWSPELVNGNQT